jgi:hypothetical protein
MKPATSDEASYLLYLDAYFKRNAHCTIRECDNPRFRLADLVITGAYGLLCKSLSDLINVGYKAATPWGLLNELLEQFPWVQIPKRHAVVISTSVRATVELERGRAELVNELRREIEKQEEDASIEEASIHD